MAQASMIFAKRLKLARNFRHWTMKQLAEKASVTPSMICTWEKEQAEPGLFSAARMAIALDVSLEWLTGRTETP